MKDKKEDYKFETIIVNTVHYPGDPRAYRVMLTDSYSSLKASKLDMNQYSDNNEVFVELDESVVADNVKVTFPRSSTDVTLNHSELEDLYLLLMARFQHLYGGHEIRTVSKRRKV